MSSYQYRKSHCGDKTVVRSSYLHNGISYTGKITSLYWIRAQVIWDATRLLWRHFDQRTNHIMRYIVYFLTRLRSICTVLEFGKDNIPCVWCVWITAIQRQFNLLKDAVKLSNIFYYPSTLSCSTIFARRGPTTRLDKMMYGLQSSYIRQCILCICVIYIYIYIYT